MSIMLRCRVNKAQNLKRQEIHFLLSSYKRGINAHGSSLFLLYPCDTVNLDRFCLAFDNSGFERFKIEKPFSLTIGVLPH